MKKTQQDLDAPVILLVDDQPGNLKPLCAFLQGHNFHIRIAENGERALQALGEQPVDLVLLDVMMPGLDGFATCRRLKGQEATRDIPVIFMTALDSIEDKVSGFGAGGVDYISKPFQQVEVLARINTHITLYRQRRQLEQALAEIKQLSGILPICCYCKKIRNDAGYWQQVEEYISRHSEVRFSHGLCPDCLQKQMEELDRDAEKL